MHIKVQVDRVAEKDNRKVMFGTEEIASGTFGNGKSFSVLQSENRNVLTIISDGYYNHITVNDIILEVLKQNLSVKLTSNPNLIRNER